MVFKSLFYIKRSILPPTSLINNHYYSLIIHEYYYYYLLFISVNCLDRHARDNPDRVAVLWEKDEPKQHESVTYK